ncbi:MAG: outer membrane lipoprotein-sorting protein [Rhodoferax sp.]
MNLPLSSWVAALALAAAAGAPAQSLDVRAALQGADRYRMPAESVQVDTLVAVYKTDGTLDKERRYTVIAQGNRQSLVLMQSPAEKGQKVLMLGDDFWLLMPASQRPMRITPMQKLLGDASTGDVATLRWSDDYSATLAGQERCQGAAPGAPEQPCWHLSLAATRKGVTYQRIELWLGMRHEPLRADLYVQSDKLAKQARFVLDKPAAPSTVTEMVLQDQLSNHKETRVRYLARKERTAPAAWFNPMFLATNPNLE